MHAEEGELRLTGGFTSAAGAQYGRLEVFSRGGWGTVCGGVPVQRSLGGPSPPAPFSAASAAVACRQLGFEEGFVTATPVCEPIKIFQICSHTIHFKIDS